MDINDRISEINSTLDIHLNKIREKFKNGVVYDIKRSLIYNGYKEIIALELEKLTEENENTTIFNKLDFIIKSIQNTENAKIPESPNTLERNILEIMLDVLRSFLEIYIEFEKSRNDDDIDNELNYYPEYNDEYFNAKIFAKREFNKNRIPLITNDHIKESEKHGFEKSPTQKFVKNFISEYTPYNGILLWHDVGVGKTCAGIGIAENFRDSVYSGNKKILILTPSDTLQQNWKDEILNIEKEIVKHAKKEVKNVQCTGSRYTNELPSFDIDNPTKLRRNANKIINKYYEFYGYQKLAKQIKNRLEKNLEFGPMKKFINKAKINYIKKTFSNRVIVMDEVHVTRDSGTPKDKIAKPWIELIVRYAENTKIVLLTATPMYNLSREIIWLLNILLLNDKKSPIEESDIFEKDGEELKHYDEDTYYGETAKKILIKKSRGYVSFLKGENPFTFPIKLHPNDSNVYTPQPKIDKKGNNILKDDHIKNMKFYKNSLSEWQYDHLLKYTNSITDEEAGVLETDVSSSFAQKPTQASNIVFPTNRKDDKGNIIGEISDKGFKECFNEDEGKFSLKEHVKTMENKKSFLDLDNLGMYSIKFKNIISSIKTNSGIGFVYSQFIGAGVLSLALALEANGFSRYMGNGKDENLLKDASKDRFCSTHLKYESELTSEEKENFTPARYILLTAQHSSVNSRNQLVKECRGTIENPNTNGELIKVILGTRVVEQGISFRRIREIHIMDPWHHLNQMHQAEGRGFRYKSHMELAEKQRNVTVYLHIGSRPKQNKTDIETSDEYIYRRAFAKKTNMAEIEYLLKKNAVDCQLNKLGNLFLNKNYDNLGYSNPLKNKTIIDSKSNKRIVNLSDIEFSDKCNFKECEYKCYPESVEYDNISIDSNTFNEFFAEDDITLIKEYIKTIFDKEWVYSEKEIIDIVSEVVNLDIAEEYIYIALTEIINNKEIVYDMYKRRGYIINRDIYYIFQPYEYKDENMPILYRYLHNYNKVTRVNLSESFKHSKVQPKTKFKKTSVVKKTPIKSDTGFKEIQSILRNVFNDAQNFVNDPSSGSDARGYFDYPDVRSEDNKIPSKNDLIDCLFLSYIEKFPKIHNIDDPQEHILMYVLTSKINNVQLSEIDKRIVEIIMRYYDTPNTNSIIIRKNQVDSSDSQDIVGFRFFNKSYKLYLIDDSVPAKLVKMDMQDFKQLKFLKSDLPDNTNLLFGFVEDKKGSTRFNIVNKDDAKFKETYNKGSKTKNKKTERTGAVCGQALGARLQTDLYKIINSMVGFEKHYKSKATKGNKEQSVYNPTKRNVNTKLTEIDFDKMEFKATLCQEIELLLRYREMIDTSVNKEYRHFYRLEEVMAINSFKEQA